MAVDAAGEKSSNTLAELVLERCELLGGCTDTPAAGSICRLFLGPGMKQAHELLRGWMREQGLSCRVDGAGNLIGRRAGSRKDGPVLLLGSHIDSVPDGGKYDGVLGVLVALASVEMLRGVELGFHVDVIAFSEEEGVRYGLPYIGSHAIAGKFDAAWLDRTDVKGITMREAMRDFGLSLEEIGAAAYKREELLGYLEVHLEQGLVLEKRKLSVGVVTAIAGQSRMWISFVGEAGHAGTTPMEGRKDSLVTAARLIVEASEYGKSVEDLRVTAGYVKNAPNAVNVIPGATEMTLDVRHPRNEVREKAVSELIAKGEKIAEEMGVRFVVEKTLEQAATAMDAGMVKALSDAVSGMGMPVTEMVSGAGHDAVAVAAVTGTGMLFMRHPGGVSHHPDERVNRADVAAAIEVMAGFLRRMEL